MRDVGEALVVVKEKYQKYCEGCRKCDSGDDVYGLCYSDRMRRFFFSHLQKRYLLKVRLFEKEHALCISIKRYENYVNLFVVRSSTPLLWNLIVDEHLQFVVSKKNILYNHIIRVGLPEDTLKQIQIIF